MAFSRVLIDGDILVYRIGFTTQDVDEGIAKWRLDELLERIMGACECKESHIYLTASDRSNFRFALFPEYKAHRKDKPKPIHYDFIRKTLMEDYMGIMISNEEADDAMGIALTEDPEHRIIATIDKDLDMIPGWHFNFVKEKIYYINELEGWRNFYYQCLVGDKSTDNIEGCPGIGPVKATRSLEGCESENEMYEKVLDHFLNAYSDPEIAVNALWLAGQLLWIRRKPEQPWVRPNGEVVSKTMLREYYEMEGYLTSMNLRSCAT
jgi:5'-3' exonuclease